MRKLIMAGSFIFLWEGIVKLFYLPPYLLPTPWAVTQSFIGNINLLIHHAIPTAMVTLLGGALGICLGALYAMLLSLYPWARRWFLPLLVMSQAIPTFVIAPLIVIWLGYGMASKITVTVLLLFFPVASAFFDGLLKTELGWLELASVMNASRLTESRYIRIPAALPALFSGIRVATVFAPMGAIIAEWVGSSSGLGFLLMNANARMQIDLMFATLMVIFIFSLTLYFGVNYLLKKCFQHEGSFQ